MMKAKIRQVGIYGGSFNPIHLGHVALADYICSWAGLDELWFMVTPQNPLKTQSDLWDDRLRLRLAQIATKAYPHFHVSDFEFHLPRPSYTVTTLEALRKAYPDCRFTLVIGADNWQRFPQWRNPDEILSHHRVLIYPRPHCHVIAESLPQGVSMVDAPLFDISSTQIRQALAEGTNLPHCATDISRMLHP
ncbi:MAG: nicotinate (nicotinamide) nucleotide adenylyltransferase, partial [Bacteroidales bacterium]|nr:nicotinate (nicotinamide) nucleotide adenylyltransferase [Bacteroidales bacterium]